MSDKPKKKLGAPTKKNPELCARICEGIATGKSARAMCEEVDINQSTLWKWLDEDETFSKQYARAKEQCADYLAAEILEIADDANADKYLDDNDRLQTDHEAINRSRLRVDARKWYASKLAPKRYGEKVTNELTGDPDRPIAHSINIRFIKSDPPAP